MEHPSRPGAGAASTRHGRGWWRWVCVTAVVVVGGVAVCSVALSLHAPQQPRLVGHWSDVRNKRLRPSATSWGWRDRLWQVAVWLAWLAQPPTVPHSPAHLLPDDESYCVNAHAPLVAAALQSMHEWDVGGLRMTPSRWRAGLKLLSVQDDAADNSVIVAAVRVVALPQVGANLPRLQLQWLAIRGMQWRQLHEWLRGMMWQLQRALRGMAIRDWRVNGIPLILSSSDWTQSPRHCNTSHPSAGPARADDDTVPVFGTHAKAHACDNDGGATTEQLQHGNAGAWDIPVPSGTMWWQFQDRSRSYEHVALEGALANRATPWKRRSPTAVFRGSLTCFRYDTCDCPRAQLVAEADTVRDGVVGFEPDRRNAWLDVAIALGTDNPPRDAAAACEQRGLLPPNDTLQLARPMPLHEHALYRYVIQVPGHTYSYRLQSLLPLGSAVLRMSTRYTEWYERSLQPFHHYIPFQCPTSNDSPDWPCAGVTRAAQWAASHDLLAEGIGGAGAAFARQHLTASGMDCYWRVLLTGYSIAADKGMQARDKRVPLSEWEATVVQALGNEGWAWKDVPTPIDGA